MGQFWLENQNWLCKLWFRLYFFDVRLPDESSVTLVFFTTDTCVLHYCCYLMDRLRFGLAQFRADVEWIQLSHIFTASLLRWQSWRMIRSRDMRCCHCIEINIIEPIKCKKYFINNKTNVSLYAQIIWVLWKYTKQMYYIYSPNIPTGAANNLITQNYLHLKCAFPQPCTFCVWEHAWLLQHICDYYFHYDTFLCNKINFVTISDQCMFFTLYRNQTWPNNLI